MFCFLVFFNKHQNKYSLNSQENNYFKLKTSQNNVIKMSINIKPLPIMKSCHIESIRDKSFIINNLLSLINFVCCKMCFTINNFGQKWFVSSEWEKKLILNKCLSTSHHNISELKSSVDNATHFVTLLLRFKMR